MSAPPPWGHSVCTADLFREAGLSTAKPEPIPSDVFHLRAWEHPLSRTASTLATIMRRLLNPGGDAANVTLHLLSDALVKHLPAQVTSEDTDRCGEVMTFAMFALHSQVLECGWAPAKADTETQRPLSCCWTTRMNLEDLKRVRQRASKLKGGNNMRLKNPAEQSVASAKSQTSASNPSSHHYLRKKNFFAQLNGFPACVVWCIYIFAQLFSLNLCTVLGL